MISDADKVGWNVHACQTGAAKESSGSDIGYAIWKRNTGHRIVSERIGPNAGDREPLMVGGTLATVLEP